jgi:hypothetical protein
LRGIGKMCTPSVVEDGSVVAGESCFCHRVGTVESSNDELTNNIIRMKCDVCGLTENLDLKFKQAIGESHA